VTGGEPLLPAYARVSKLNATAHDSLFTILQYYRNNYYEKIENFYFSKDMITIYRISQVFRGYPKSNIYFCTLPVRLWSNEVSEGQMEGIQ